MIGETVCATHEPTSTTERHFINPVCLEGVLYVLRRAITLQRFVEIAAQSQRLSGRALAGCVEVAQRLRPRVAHLKQQASRHATTQLKLQSVIPRIGVISS